MINNGVQFGEIHSYNDLDLLLAPFVVPPAVPKTNMLDIPAGDGSLDFTEALGVIRYYDRELVFTFTVNPQSEMTFDEKITQVSNALNGKACNITLDRDADYFWEGRCIVNEHLQDKTINQIVIKAIVRPYKLKQEMVSKRYSVNTIERTYSITLGGKKPVIPVIRHGGYIKLTFEGKTYLIDSKSGVTTLPDFQLKVGENEFSLVSAYTDSTASIEVYLEFREGEL